MNSLALLQAGNETFQNASNSVSGGFANSVGLSPVLGLLVYGTVALLAAQVVAPWLAESQFASNLGASVAKIISYAIKGAAASAVLLVVAAPFYFAAQADPSTQDTALRWLGIGAAAFAALVVIGWLADRAVTKFIEAHPKYDSWADMFPEDSESDANKSALSND